MAVSYTHLDVYKRQGDQQLDEPAAALDCKHFTSGWRDRCYEYYAGVCDRKNERNRSEKGTGGKKKKDPDAVSDGSGSTYPSRRSDRCGRRDCACLYYFLSLIHIWLGGMLTNFKTIQSRIARLKEIEAM